MAEKTPYIPIKIADVCMADVGETVTYTILLKNTGETPLENVLVKDVMHTDILFTAGSVRVNGTNVPEADPAAGFSVPNIEPGTTLNVVLEGVLVSEPEIGVIVNTANITYDRSSAVGETPVTYSADSNPSSVNTPLADVSLTILDTPNPVDCQEILTFVYTIKNHGPTAAEEVVLNATPSSHIMMPKFSSDGGLTWTAHAPDYPIGRMDAGETVTVLLSGKIDMADEMGGKTGVSRSAAAVSAKTPDPDISNNAKKTETVVTEFADIGVVMTANPNPVEVGKDVIYEIDITNYGPCGVFGVTVVDTLDPHLENRTFSLDGATWDEWPGNYYLNKTITKDNTERIYLKATVKDETTAAISSTVSASATPVDVDASNNSSTVDLDVIFYSADLQITHFGSADVLNAGDTITYTATVKNLGPSVSTDTVISGDIASGLVAPEISKDGGATWETWTGTYNAGTLQVDEEITLLIRGVLEKVKPLMHFTRAAVTAADTTGTEVVTNTLSVGSGTKDPSTINNIATVAAAVVTPGIADTTYADLSVISSVSAPSSNNGENPVYTVTVQNAGPNDAENVLIDCSVPPEFMNTVFSVDGGITWNTFSGQYTLPALNASETVELLIRGTVNAQAASAILLTAKASSDIADADITNNFSSAVILANASSGGQQTGSSADISVIVTTSPAFCACGCEPLDFIVTVSNSGPAVANGVGLNIPVPTSLHNLFYSVDGGVTFQKWTGNIDLGTLAVNEHKQVFLREMFTCGNVGEITMTAQIYSLTSDLNYTNNQHSATIKVV